MAEPDIVATGSWLRCDYDLALHESAHGVAAVVLSLNLVSVRIDGPEVHAAGITKTRTIWNRTALRSELVGTLAGPLAEGQEIPWPPSRNAGGDEGICAELVSLLALKEDEWQSIVQETRDLLELLPTRPAIRAVAGALLERGLLPPEEVREAGGKEDYVGDYASQRLRRCPMIQW